MVSKSFKCIYIILCFFFSYLSIPKFDSMIHRRRTNIIWIRPNSGSNRFFMSLQRMQWHPRMYPFNPLSRRLLLIIIKRRRPNLQICIPTTSCKTLSIRTNTNTINTPFMPLKNNFRFRLFTLWVPLPQNGRKIMRCGDETLWRIFTVYPWNSPNSICVLFKRCNRNTFCCMNCNCIVIMTS